MYKEFLNLIFVGFAVVHAAIPNLGGYHYESNNIASNAFVGGGGGGISKDNENFFHTQPLEKAAPVYNGGDKYLPPTSSAQTQTPIITKQFFLISAPDEADEAPKTKHFVIGRPQKNYRVVFIKAPAPENANLKLTAEYAPQEEKTVIYVLSKKANEIDIGEIPAPAPTQPSKPEVFFIKYKTPEEAQAAQKEIQEQYDHLGGTSEFSDEGIVPVKSVIGSLDGLAPNGGYNYKRVNNGVSNSAIKDFLQTMRYYY